MKAKLIVNTSRYATPSAYPLHTATRSDGVYGVLLLAIRSFFLSLFASPKSNQKGAHESRICCMAPARPSALLARMPSNSTPFVDAHRTMVASE